eukprot:14165245-Alexandrium_andersonii.AAC.1
MTGVLENLGVLRSGTLGLCRTRCSRACEGGAHALQRRRRSAGPGMTVLDEPREATSARQVVLSSSLRRK